MSVKPVVGIDLGTSSSSIAVYKNGKPEVIPNAQFGDRLTPSVVFFDPKSSEISVGKYAEEWGITEKSNFVYDTKRLMGRKFDDIYVQDLIKNKRYNYKIVRGRDDNAKIEVRHDGKVVQKLPEEIASEILMYLKDSASQFLGEEISEAVISVPAHFCNAQRKATKEAAKLAGLTVIKLISEPVAAAVFYCMDNLKTRSTLLVFDFGGGTLDVSVIDTDNGKFKVEGVEGESFLGGRNIDENLLDHVFSIALATLKNSDKNYTARNLLRVKNKCIKLKIALSARKQASFTLDNFGKQNDNCFSLTMSREEFEMLNDTLFNKAIDLVTQCLSNLELLAKDVDQVVLVGGSTRIPKLQILLGKYFGEEKLRMDVNPDEAIALGAAAQAAILKGNNKELERYKVTEVAPLSIGIGVYGGLMRVGIKKNTPLPASAKIITCTSHNNQNNVYEAIYEGERKNCKFNTLLGSITLGNLPPGKAGTVQIETTFTLSDEGMLTLETWTTSNGLKKKAVILLEEHRLCQKIINNTLKDAERFKKEDDLFEHFRDFRCASRKFCYHILYDLNTISDVEKRNRTKHICEAYILYEKNATDFALLEALKGKFEIAKQEIESLVKVVLDTKNMITNINKTFGTDI